MGLIGVIVEGIPPKPKRFPINSGRAQGSGQDPVVINRIRTRRRQIEDY